MQETLIIRLPAFGTSESIPWLLWHSQQQELIASGELESTAELSQLADKAARSEVIIAIPGQDVFLTQVTLPAGSKKHLDKVIPYALEEELAADIDTLHFAWPETKASTLPVAVVEKAHMQQWLGVLTESGIESNRWLPDIFLLPAHENEWHAIELGHSVLVRTSTWQGFAVEQAAFSELAPILSSEYDSPEKIVHYGPLDWPQPPTVLESADIEVPMTITVAALQSNAEINLRQGAFRAKRQRQSSSLPWKPLAVAASVLFVLAVALNGIKYWQLEQQRASLQAKSEQLYRDAFPNETRIVNLRAQLQQKIDRAGGAGDSGRSVLAALDSLQPAFQAEPSVKLELLRFQNNELRLQATADSFSQLEAFQRAAQNSGVAIEAGSMNNRGDQVSGALTIELQG
ncbi:type II secretion system protein GspL [Idiomarina piscisalsi]|uniref:type II secretion system protein GspL n=1 Tax=Idiomarina piscisalsi TaxID=1096243 RepID=UPI00137FB3EF|nr:type II secretion system protein GspL [Idiomarina piscisalsi]MTJ02588.1 type II secretion system protein GspL [Idiomarina piscisalsi]